MSDEHTSFIKTPKQLAIVVLLAFAVPIGLIVLLSQLVTGLMPMGNSEADNAGAVAHPAGRSTRVRRRDGVRQQDRRTGVPDRLQDMSRKRSRRRTEVRRQGRVGGADQTGYDVLVQHAINGLQQQGKVMPPKGGNPDLSDTEVARAVVYMANAAGAGFKEPAAPACGRVARHRPSPIATAATPTAAAAPAAAVPPAAAAATAPLDMKTAEAMMQKDGCAACHGIDKKIVGPAYQEVAAKYRGDKDALAKLSQKVKAGGSGVWGAVPMPPNAQVSEADIKALVSWILTLKK